MSRVEPLVHELSPTPAPAEVFRRLAGQPHCVFFDSADRADKLGRCSYLAADPYAWITGRRDGPALLEEVAAKLELDRPAPTIAGIPPFQGGAAGVLSYELGRDFERVPAPRHDEFEAPALAVGLYDVVVAFDHVADRAWVVSTGRRAEAEPNESRAAARLDWMLSLLASSPSEPARSQAGETSPHTNHLADIPLALQHSVEPLPGVFSDFDRDEYLVAVQRAIDYIHAGDIFQVNLSQRLLARQTAPPAETYLRLRERNPAPFAGYADLGAMQVCSASPERFLSVADGRVETRPIKGTRPRSADPTRDAQLAMDLLEHPKDRAENVMIVDLLRNDLSRVCTPASVRVPTLCGLESYRHVHHLVSVVEGRLRDDQSLIDLLRASFPGGSITGAPKVRAMEIIAELEPTARGPYCGSLFWAGFNGAMDSSILIRTAVCAGGWVQTSVGGGIVADSDPVTEYEETLHKAKGMMGAS